MIILLKVNNLERMLDTKSRGLQCVQDNTLIHLSFQMVIMPHVLVVCYLFLNLLVTLQQASFIQVVSYLISVGNLRLT